MAEQSDKPVAVSLNHLPTTGEHLFGRDEVLSKLDAAWEDPGTNVISIVAWAGVGKSAIVTHWVGRMAKDGWRGARSVFGWSFPGQGGVSAEVSAGEFFGTALKWFSSGESNVIAPVEKGKRLAEGA